MPTRNGIRSKLVDIRRFATLKTMDVSEIFDRNAPVKMADGTPVTEKNVSDFIRERLRLHHDTYIIGPLDELIKRLEK